MNTGLLQRLRVLTLHHHLLVRPGTNPGGEVMASKRRTSPGPHKQTQAFLFSTGVQEAGCEVLTLKDFFHDVVRVHPRVVHPLELRLHGVLFHRVSVESFTG